MFRDPLGGESFRRDRRPRLAEPGGVHDYFFGSTDRRLNLAAGEGVLETLSRDPYELSQLLS